MKISALQTAIDNALAEGIAAGDRPHNKCPSNLIASGFSPRKKIPEQKTAVKSISWQHAVARGSDFGDRVLGLFQRRSDVALPAQQPQSPTRWQRRGSPDMVAKTIGAIEAENRDNPSRSQKTLEAHEGRPQWEMVQSRDGGDEVKAGLGERIAHDIAFDVLYGGVCAARSTSAGDRRVIRIYADDLPAIGRKTMCKEARAASDIQGAPALGRNRTDNEIIVMNVVVPRLAHLFHRTAGWLIDVILKYLALSLENDTRRLAACVTACGR